MFYGEVDLEKKFVLWRHDIDFSIDQSLKIARINHELGLKSTFFILLHSDFYNPLENSMREKLLEINSLGHQIGLHFDASYYDIFQENQINDHVLFETEILKKSINLNPVAVSFHNPRILDLTFESEMYGGLVNAYSKKLKSGIDYCSDSNGYWRFRELHEVLSEVNSRPIQVLTHPTWWQDRQMPPRQRIYRTISERARVTIENYDKTLKKHGRENKQGKSQVLNQLKAHLPEEFFLWDYLWNQSKLESLLLDMSGFHKNQVRLLCVRIIMDIWMIEKREAEALCQTILSVIPSERILQALTNDKSNKLFGKDQSRYKKNQDICKQVFLGHSTYSKTILESECEYISQLIFDIIKCEYTDLIVAHKSENQKHLPRLHVGEIGSKKGARLINLEKNLEDQMRNNNTLSIWIDFVNRVTS
jgi:hypothetical protein